MTNKVIIHPSDDGQCLLTWPSPNVGIPVEEIARKDVPAGKPYRIIETTMLPSEVVFYDALEADFSQPDGFGIGQEAWFAEQAAKAQQ